MSKQANASLRNRGQMRQNRQGKDFDGFTKYFNDIWRNPSLVKMQRKTKEEPRKIKEKQRQSKGKPRKNIFLIMFPELFSNWTPAKLNHLTKLEKSQ